MLIKGHNSDTNMRKRMCDNPKLSLAKMNANLKYCKILSIGSQDIERKQTFAQNQDHNSGTNEQKMTCKNPKLDLVNMNAYIKFGKIMSVSSEDIEQKQNCALNQGP